MHNSISSELESIIDELNLRLTMQELLTTQLLARIASASSKPAAVIDAIIDDTELVLALAGEETEDTSIRDEARRAAAYFRNYQAQLRALAPQAMKPAGNH